MGNDDWQKDDPVKVGFLSGVETESPKKKESTDTKKSKWGRKSTKDDNDDDITIHKEKCCNARLKRYMSIWSFFVLCLAIGIVLMIINIIIPGLVIFLVGLGGLFCAGWCFRKCGSKK